MKTLEYIKNKYNLNLDQRMPIEIPNVGRNEMIKWLSEDELNFENLIEVGVAGGEYSRLICENNIFANIYGIDPWKKYREYSDYRKETTFMKMEEDARNRMKDFPNYTFIKKTSLEALDDFKDESLDFVYIDANHRDPYITEDVKGWYKKVKKGGILAGHD